MRYINAEQVSFSFFFFLNTYRFVHVAQKVYMTQTELRHEQGPRNADVEN